jgi:hypothetical protein
MGLETFVDVAEKLVGEHVISYTSAVKAASVAESHLVHLAWLIMRKIGTYEEANQPKRLSRSDSISRFDLKMPSTRERSLAIKCRLKDNINTFCILVP